MTLPRHATRRRVPTDANDSCTSRNAETHYRPLDARGVRDDDQTPQSERIVCECRAFEFSYSARVLSPKQIFGPDSPFEPLLNGFQPRDSQIWMAEAVTEAIEQSRMLIVEAGTGTGKTFAYLVPALLSGRKTIVSTGTKALQDQLYHRDLRWWAKPWADP